MEIERNDDEWLEESPLEETLDAEPMRDATEAVVGVAKPDHTIVRVEAATDEPNGDGFDPVYGVDRTHTIGANPSPSAQELPGGPPIRSTDRDQGDGGSSNGDPKPGPND